ARRISSRDLDRLIALVAAMDAARDRDDTARFQDLNTEFHAVLVVAADNFRLQQVYNGLAKELRLFRRRGLASGEAMEASNREHRAIVEAIAARDAAGAAAAMAQHILQGKARFLSAAANELAE